MLFSSFTRPCNPKVFCLIRFLMSNEPYEKANAFDSSQTIRITEQLRSFTVSPKCALLGRSSSSGLENDMLYKLLCMYNIGLDSFHKLF